MQASQGAGSQYASFTMEDLANVVPAGSADTHDSHFVAISPVYNFVISGLAQQGDSAAVVIPLVSSGILPIGVSYRKYNTRDGWYTFVEDDNNRVSSALSDDNGNCPAGNDDSYVLGLNEGDNCVQLLIEDGGANDTDINVNGSIEDPGVFVIENVNSAPVIELDSELEVNEETTTTLDASQTADADALTYSWVQLSGTTVELTGANTSMVTFTSPSVSVDEQLMFELTIDDSRDSTSAIITVTVLQINQAPTVSIAALATSYEEGARVTISSQGSDSDEFDILSYQWQQLSGPAITFDDSISAQTIIRLPQVSTDAVIEVQVTVTDGDLSVTTTTNFTVTDKVEVITITPANKSSGGSMGWLIVIALVIGVRKSRLTPIAA